MDKIKQIFSLEAKLGEKKVGFRKALLLYFKNFFNFNGRSSIGAHWYCFILFPLDALWIPIIGHTSLAVRRLHDTGLSGFWLLLGFIPLIGPLILIYLLVRPSTKGINQFGEDIEAGIKYTDKAKIDGSTFEFKQNDEVADLIKEIDSLESLNKCIVLYYLTLCRCGAALAPFDSIIMKGTFMGAKSQNYDFLKIQKLLEQHLISHNSNISTLLEITSHTKEKELINTVHKATEIGIRILLHTCASRENRNQFFRIVNVWSQLIESVNENQKLINSTEYEKDDLEPASILRGLIHKNHGHENKMYSGNQFLLLMKTIPTYEYL
jgi:uncharacterized membrane protein YhaH (DUF805 family)